MRLRNAITKYYRVLILVLLTGCNEDVIERYIARTAVVVNSVNPESNEYADLLPIGSAIGDARIVMLGEQDHGDAPTFLAKTRLVKYLHEKKGFNVLAFESDFFGLTEGWDKLAKTKEEIAAFARKNVFKIWSYCDACRYLFDDYIPGTHNSEKPIELAGFDSQLTLDYSERNLARLMDSVLTQYDLPVTKTKSYQKLVKEDLNNLVSQYEKRNGSPAFYRNMGEILSEIESDLAVKADPGNYWLLVVQNLIQYNKQLAAKKVNLSNSERDKQMALNLRWLVDHRFKKEKIIVWAHNLHIMKNMDHLSDSKYRFINMSTNFLNSDKDLSDQVYVLGFTSGKGVAGRLGMEKYQVPSGETKSVDGVLLKLNYPFAFFDFNKFNKRYPTAIDPFLMKGAGHGYGKERWNTVFNGVFYIKEMYPCNPSPSFGSK